MKLLLIDGTNLVMRCASIPDFDTVEKVTGAALRLAHAAIEHTHATHCVAVFDGPRAESARRAIYAGYKADRTSSTEEWSAAAFDHFTGAGLYALRCVEWEGDDYLASLAMRARFAAKVAVLSSDSDMLALLAVGFTPEHEVEVWKYGRGDEPRFVRCTREYVREKYGVYPHQLEDYKALAGEPGDNVPGPFGKKCVGKARKMLAKYGSVERVLEEAGLTDEQALALKLAREVLHLRLQVAVPAIPPKACRIPVPVRGVAA